MKRTKAQLEAQLTTAQSLVVRHQETITKLLNEFHELRQEDKSRVAELHSDNVALTSRVRELDVRLQARGGRLEELRDLALQLAHGYKKYR